MHIHTHKLTCKYSQNMTCICKIILSVKHMNVLLPQFFQKSGYNSNACNNITDILYNTDVISSVVKLIVHSLVGRLV